MSTANDTRDFDDELHQFLNMPRPKLECQMAAVRTAVEGLVEACIDQDDKWKRLVLSILHKRYHVRAPEAKALRSTAADNTNTSKSEIELATGDGERKLFYLAVKALFKKCLSQEDEDDLLAEKETIKTCTALQVLLGMAPHVGGSRDICSLLEECLGDMIERSALVSKRKKDMLSNYGKESLGLLVGTAVLECLAMFSQSQTCSHIEHLVQVGADLLTFDLSIVRQEQEAHAFRIEKVQPDNLPTSKDIPSTLHVFLPHHERGAPPRGKKRRNISDATIPQRQLVNCVAEILIWSRAPAAMGQVAFAGAYKNFLAAASRGDKEVATKTMLTMQTIVRKLRRELNNYARSKGFMLSNQFELKGDSGLDLGMVRRGKEADVALLSKRANSSTEVLSLINARFLNPNKVVKFADLREISENWGTNTDAVCEVAGLQRGMSLARLRATVSYLRSVVNMSGASADRGTSVASLSPDKASNVAAVLTAASLADWEVIDTGSHSDGSTTQSTTAGEKNTTGIKLFIEGKETFMDSFNSCVALVDAIVSPEINCGGSPSTLDANKVPTTKAVMNLLDRHIGEGESLIFISQATIELPEDIYRSLSNRGCRVHCHDVDDIGARLEREKAEKGDITISLAWDTGDDLDLHVLVPSGEEISYRTHQSKCGLCCLDVDMNAGGPTSTEPVENVFCGKLDKQIEAPKGEYKVIVHNYEYHSSKQGSPIPWRIVLDKNDTKEYYSGTCIGTDRSSRVTACTFNYTGRTVPWKEETNTPDAFAKSNLVDITTSTGQTIESLSNLVNVLNDQEHLDRARVLVDDSDDNTSVANCGDEYGGVNQTRPNQAPAGRLEVTSRDRLDILLSKLPARFHRAVNQAFGGSPPLAEACAKEVASRMVSDNIPLSELKRNGYPTEIIEAVKRHLASSMTSAVAAR